jgi:hypothetical protein
VFVVSNPVPGSNPIWDIAFYQDKICSIVTEQKSEGQTKQN